MDKKKAVSKIKGEIERLKWRAKHRLTTTKGDG